MDYLVNNWDVNVTVTKFDGGLAASIALMQETDVLVGVHGAGAGPAACRLPLASSWVVCSSLSAVPYLVFLLSSAFHLLAKLVADATIILICNHLQPCASPCQLPGSCYDLAGTCM